MSGPRPHSNQRPLGENETLELRARMHANRGPNLRQQMSLYQSMARHGIWYANMQISALKYDTKQPRNMETWHPMHGMNPETRN